MVLGVSNALAATALDPAALAPEPAPALAVALTRAQWDAVVEKLFESYLKDCGRELASEERSDQLKIFTALARHRYCGAPCPPELPAARADDAADNSTVGACDGNTSGGRGHSVVGAVPSADDVNANAAARTNGALERQRQRTQEIKAQMEAEERAWRAEELAWQLEQREQAAIRIQTAHRLLTSGRVERRRRRVAACAAERAAERINLAASRDEAARAQAVRATLEHDVAAAEKWSSKLHGVTAQVRIELTTQGARDLARAVNETTATYEARLSEARNLHQLELTAVEAQAQTAVSALEQLRLSELQRASAVCIQAAQRRLRWSRRYGVFKAAAVRIQRRYRCETVGRVRARRRHAATLLQVAYRGWRSRGRARREKEALLHLAPHRAAWVSHTQRADGPALEQLIDDVAWTSAWAGDIPDKAGGRPGYRTAAEIATSAAKLPWQSQHTGAALRQQKQSLRRPSGVQLPPLGEVPTPRQMLPPTARAAAGATAALVGGTRSSRGLSQLRPVSAPAARHCATPPPGTASTTTVTAAQLMRAMMAEKEARHFGDRQEEDQQELGGAARHDTTTAFLQRRGAAAAASTATGSKTRPKSATARLSSAVPRSPMGSGASGGDDAELLQLPQHQRAQLRDIQEITRETLQLELDQQLLKADVLTELAAFSVELDIGCKRLASATAAVHAAEEARAQQEKVGAEAITRAEAAHAVELAAARAGKQQTDRRLFRDNI